MKNKFSIAMSLAVILAMLLTSLAFADGTATIASEFDDYGPGQIVNLFGTGWQPGESVHIFVNDNVGSSWSLNSYPDPVADGSGGLTYQFQLPNWFVATYSVTATGATSTASTTFTDSVTSVTLTSPTHSSPITITSLPATVTFSFNYVTSNTGTTTGQADILGPGLSNTKSLSPGTHSDSIVVNVPVGTINGTYNAKLTVTNSTGSGSNNGNDNQNAAIIIDVPTCTAPSVSVNPSSATKTVGQSVTFSVTASGTGPLSYQWRKDGGNVGTNSSSYSIASVVTADAGNYDVVVTNGCGTATSSAATLTVNKATPTVNTWPTASDITYGQALSASTLTGGSASVAGSFSFTTPSTTPNAGLYNAAVTFTPTDSANYNTVSGTVNVNVNKALLTVTADSFTITYGAADPSFTFQYSGFVLSDGAGVVDTAPTCGTAAPGPHNAAGSPYAINCSGGADDNYNFSYVPGSLTVNKALLIVTANNQTKLLNAANPPLTFAYSGFVLGDGAGVVDTAPTCSTTAVTNSPVGSYPINCSGGADDNYNFSYAPGSLTITYAPAGTMCMGAPSGTILQPINADGSSVFKKGSTVPAKFRVCDANGASIGTPGVVSSFTLVKVVVGLDPNGVVEDSTSYIIDSTANFSEFRWSSADMQWIFNINTKNLTASRTYFYRITLNDGSTIEFHFGLK